ncbi:branched-chain alpha-keto acid dehydrogenase subunit E2 [Rosistilla carotiformis]|uniref:Branched-chain alpha-keto acid dehydrogenase subunit E2 n=2 Tax=Rosistilla carotiformis TaxID=2528017 RepID=A0A518JYK9_9BACT|nr:branched-chain alpha-keto acid dehydrogenase subunit E2 [Rosistilla carotiformis]
MSVAKMKKGHWRKLSKNRRLVLDVCALSRRMPLFPAERTIDLTAVAEARGASSQRISWAAIFTKAFALTAAQQPQLRQTYYRLPWPHLYEHNHSVASIAMHRFDGDEDRLCWARIRRVEELSLADLQSRLDDFKSQPIDVAFKSQLRMSRLPMPIRRLMWGLALNLSGRSRAKSVGTFSMSSVAGLGAYNRFHPTMLTSSLSYGPIDDDGRCLVTLICDHRVIDGYRAAICLQQIESILQGPIVDELDQTLPSHTAAARAA